MRVLWVINGPISEISKKLNISSNDSTGWLAGYLSELRKNKGIELFVAFPLIGEKRIITEEIDNVSFISFFQKPVLKKMRIPSSKVTQLSIRHLNQIIGKVNPDVMHIFGSEFEHSLIAAKIFNNPSNTIVHIQGLVSAISQHYYAGLPKRVLGKFAVSNLLRGSIKSQKEKFHSRGRNEVELIKYVKHVDGRTDWDKACVKRINPEINYHFCNESLRNDFYNHQWSIDKCNKKVIFMSQATYPVKGLHFAIEAIKDLKKEYPDIKLKIAGNNLIDTRGLYNKLKISSYGLYIRSLIMKYDLMDNIEFTGFLSEIEMVNNLLQANVFISASVIENSPNSVGEAMLVGTPVVTSDVGGTKNIFVHGIDGFSYQYDAPYMLVYYITKILEDETLAVKFSGNSRQKALMIYNKTKNSQNLSGIYRDIAKFD